MRGVSFAVEKGAIFGLLGPSGAGKSTIQRVLTRQARRYVGAVHALGRDLREWDWRYYERIGVGFEFPIHYLKLTARENLRFFASLYRAATPPPEALLERVGLADAAKVRVAEFSKGMMVRLNFVRAVMHDPDLIFLDEPTAGLDPVNTHRIRELIRAEHRAGKTIVLTTHNMHDVEALCDRVAFIVEGEMAVEDRPQALKLKHGSRTVRVEFGADGDARSEIFPLDGLASNAEFQALLREGEVRTLHSQEATLDRVFAEVTGVALDEIA